jgi:ribosomal protein L39E
MQREVFIICTFHQNIIAVKLRMTLALYVARQSKTNVDYPFWKIVRKFCKTRYKMTILKTDLKEMLRDVGWIQLAHDKDQ